MVENNNIVFIWKRILMHETRQGNAYAKTTIHPKEKKTILAKCRIGGLQWFNINIRGETWLV